MMASLIEPFFYCLLASVVWAPIVFLIASRFHNNDASSMAGALWPSALLIAALPALLAPVAAAFGLSLRNPAPLPPMNAPSIAANYAPATPITTTLAQQSPAMSLTEILTTVAGLYFYGFILFAMLGAVRLIWFSYRVRFAYEVDEPDIDAGFEQWRQRMGLVRTPRYAFTDAVSSVCVHGFFRPVILMPMSLLDRVSVKDAILMGAHEMAHIKRGDTWLFAFITIVKAVFWFNPFVHHIAARANLAAEQAADALVISRGANRRQYAQCFVEGLRFAAGAPRGDHALVPSFTPFDKRSRRERLNAILSKTGGAPLLGAANKTGLVLSIVAATGLAFAQAALAVAPKPPEEALPQSPLDGEVTFEFGKKSKLLGGERKTHEGVDIKAPRGTKIRAAGGGKVVAATKRYKGQTSWGNVVVIDHGHGLVTRYAHLDGYVVKKGDRVDAGDVIGTVGSTGKSSGPHLHFEVLQDGLNIDPAPVIATAPLPAPKPHAALKPSRKVMVSPAPAIIAQPPRLVSPNETAPYVVRVRANHNHSLDEKLEKRLAGKRAKIEERLREQFQEFRALSTSGEFDFDFDELESDAQTVFEDFADTIGDLDFQFAGLDELNIVMPEIASLGEAFKLSDKDRAEIRRIKEEVIRETARAKREIKIEIKRARNVRKREMREVERERAEAMKDARFDREEMLALREQALEEAQIALEQERVEIERMRAELKRQKRDQKSK
ncbi:MAG: peptidoglycan DD-metalloendopeptidase family protein [Alphaproteobacteria bacterium]|nr:peptidoglycan DD-metalloendopeptidase family protein [Alphaproteobacteria bacterium]